MRDPKKQAQAEERVTEEPEERLPNRLVSILQVISDSISNAGTCGIDEWGLYCGGTGEEVLTEVRGVIEHGWLVIEVERVKDDSDYYYSGERVNKFFVYPVKDEVLKHFVSETIFHRDDCRKVLPDDYQVDIMNGIVRVIKSIRDYEKSIDNLGNK